MRSMDPSPGSAPSAHAEPPGPAVGPPCQLGLQGWALPARPTVRRHKGMLPPNRALSIFIHPSPAPCCRAAWLRVHHGVGEEGAEVRARSLQRGCRLWGEHESKRLEHQGDAEHTNSHRVSHEGGTDGYIMYINTQFV